MFSKKVEELLQVFLDERTDLFLIDLKVSSGNDIVVILDGDEGVTLQDCLDASRAIENNLDREEEDFSLQVMSAGLSEPLTLPRQYAKNIGRALAITTKDGKSVKGELSSTDENGIVLLHKYRKPKEVGKGKVDAVEEIKINYPDIAKAVIEIKF